MYRSAVLGSESSQEPVQKARKLGGYPAFSADHDHTAPVFRPVPTRWIIWRTLRPGKSGEIMLRYSTVDKPYKQFNGPACDPNSVHTKFFVQGVSCEPV